MILPLLLCLSVAVGAPTVAVSATAAGFADAESRALVGKATAEVGAAGAVPVTLRSGAVATPACLADPACARGLLAGGEASLLVAVDVLRAGSRAAITARVVDTSGTLVAESATVISVAKLLGGSAAMLTPAITARLHPAALPTTAPTAAPPPPVTPAPPPPPSAPVVPPAPVVQPAAAAPTAAPAASAAPGDEALTTNAILGVGAAAAGTLFFLGGTAAALGQNALRLDGGADGDDRAATALTIPLAMGVAVLGLAGVGVGAFLLMSGSDDVAPPLTAP
jgi:hypothetical protein